MKCASAWVASIACVILLLVPPVLAVDRPGDDEIDRAIAEGMEFLRSQQERDGSWTYNFNQNHRLGITALAGLALMENGVDRDDPVIHKAATIVTRLAPESDQTYDLSLAILFLARYQKGARGEFDDLIQQLAERLTRGEFGGMWTYTVPREPSTGSRRYDGPSGGIRPPPFTPGTGDNSNTQFALLGLWAAGRHGFASNDPLADIEVHFRNSQHRTGFWGYKPGMPHGEAMTCAGLIALAIGAARPEKAERLTARARGDALANDLAFQNALEIVTEDARRIDGNSDIYYLWSLERVCVALGLRELDGLDWYAAGARELLSRQTPGGGWPDSRWGTLPDTCLALLFLRKANLAFELDRVLKLPGAKSRQSGRRARRRLASRTARDRR